MNTQKLRRPFLLTLTTITALVIGASCGGGTENRPGPAATPTPAISPEVANPGEAAVQKLRGRWDGAEGSYLSVTEKMGSDGQQQRPRKFEIEIMNNGKAEKFDGTAKDGTIEFIRNGRTETLKAATGADTGMKGFDKEANCVVVTKAGEGFCKTVAATTTAPATSPTSSPAT